MGDHSMRGDEIRLVEGRVLGTVPVPVLFLRMVVGIEGRAGLPAFANEKWTTAQCKGVQCSGAEVFTPTARESMICDG